MSPCGESGALMLTLSLIKHSPLSRPRSANQNHWFTCHSRRVASSPFPGLACWYTQVDGHGQSRSNDAHVSLPARTRQDFAEANSGGVRPARLVQGAASEGLQSDNER